MSAELEARIASLEAQLSTIANAPALRAYTAEQARISRIRGDADTIAKLVAGSPDERVAVLAGLSQYRLAELLGLCELPSLITIARDLPTPALAAIMRAADSTIRVRLAVEIMPAADVGDWVRVRGTSARVADLDAQSSITLRRAAWEARCADPDLRDHVAAGRILVEELDERAARNHLATIAELDDQWRPIIAAEQTAKSARSSLDARAKAKEIKERDAQACIEANRTEHAELPKRGKARAAAAREARIEETAEALSRALAKSAKKGSKL